MTFAGWPFVPVDSDAANYDREQDERAAGEPYGEFPDNFTLPTVAHSLRATATAPVLASSPREGGGRGLTSARDRSGMQTGSGPTNPPREENS